MLFCFTKTLAGGAIPRTPSTKIRAPKGGPPEHRSSSGARWRGPPSGDCRASRPRGDARAPDGQPLGEQVPCRHGAALNPFPEGSLVRERPGGEGGMGLHMPGRPYAAPGIPKGRVAPVHGPQTRIGSGDPQAVVQPQAVRRLRKLAFRMPRWHSPAQAPRCRFRTSGSATGSAERRSRPDFRARRRSDCRTGLHQCPSITPPVHEPPPPPTDFVMIEHGDPSFGQRLRLGDWHPLRAPHSRHRST